MDSSQFTFKKLLAALIGIGVAVMQKDLGIPSSTAQEIILMCAVYIIGQGIADHGKSAAVVYTRRDERAKETILGQGRGPREANPPGMS